MVLKAVSSLLKLSVLAVVLDEDLLELGFPDYIIRVRNLGIL